MLLNQKLNLAFAEAIKTLQSFAGKALTEAAKARAKCNQVGEDYKKTLREVQRLTKEVDDKASQLKQMQVELSFLQDTVSAQKEKIKALSQNESELSIYRSSANSLKSLDINNELWTKKHHQEPAAASDQSKAGGRAQDSPNAARQDQRRE